MQDPAGVGSTRRAAERGRVDLAGGEGHQGRAGRMRTWRAHGWWSSEAGGRMEGRRGMRWCGLEECEGEKAQAAVVGLPDGRRGRVAALAAAASRAQGDLEHPDGVEAAACPCTLRASALSGGLAAVKRPRAGHTQRTPWLLRGSSPWPSPSQSPSPSPSPSPRHHPRTARSACIAGANDGLVR